mmetsp:Transcript_6587/g.11941  ORF Transcript_6587/g.11941 Transcript_6587/m.11941 type:complete len:161 (-) Transcript_6587:161-643(-)|eukprot:CAMPEP_0201599654 /NCGR_PEP_ID=MMETSP0492-20130828/1022_1 /ASSEMBLY_ACC=CAM_ASM_000837 /TAXON_ID=420259 /ORGANISM="Thalassiosira gravida, Strain GMp14c1" /LENGTH=160 /DNA_ID=CAMNT_0048062273 /DNA_START=44 /DNA_END=526 /DNA_ORIENTATION=-
MKSAAFLLAAAVAMSSSDVDAFSSFNGQQLQNGAQNAGRSMTMEYIPSGMSKAQWKKIKDAEKGASNGKDLGKVGITSFKSRSFAEWQKAGGINLFPVDPKSVKSQDEIPYMQRQGGMADGSDLKGGTKKKAPTFFNMGGKKKAPEPEPVAPTKKKNWWS